MKYTSLILLIIIWINIIQTNGDDSQQDATTTSSTVGTPPPSTTPPDPPVEEPLVDFFLTNSKISKQSYNQDSKKWISYFDGSCKTTYIVPGYLTGNQKIYDELIAAFLKLDECYNLVFCYWPSSFDPDYINACQSTYDVGGVIGQHILDLYGKAILQGYVEIVGHGLGAHVGGCAGKTTQSVLPLDCITGLDPAGELFTDGYTAFEDFKLAPTDANRVVCLHTNSNGYGTSKECGKYDFYANNGSKQPGIIFEHHGYYSHMKSLPYFIEALQSESLVSHGPLGFPTTRFGRTMPKNTPAGKYYFKTNTRPPYGRN